MIPCISILFKRQRHRTTVKILFFKYLSRPFDKLLRRYRRIIRNADDQRVFILSQRTRFDHILGNQRDCFLSRFSAEIRIADRRQYIASTVQGNRHTLAAVQNDLRSRRDEYAVNQKGTHYNQYD